MDIEIPGIDVDSGLKTCGRKMDIYLLSLSVYVSDMPAHLEEMKGVCEKTLKDYSVVVHAVKSMSQYIGAEDTRLTAMQLEAMARAGDLAGVLARNEAFIKHAQSIVDSVRNWLEKTGNK